jgi:hypothetical protein
MANVQIREGQIYWIRDLDRSASTTAYPTSTTAGVVIPATKAAGYLGSRVHVYLEATVAAGSAISVTAALYGLPRVMGDMTTSPSWAYLGSFNNGSSMTADTSKWSNTTADIRVAEVFTAAPANYERFATRQIGSSGTGLFTTTYIGFPEE